MHCLSWVCSWVHVEVVWAQTVGYIFPSVCLCPDFPVNYTSRVADPDIFSPSVTCCVNPMNTLDAETNISSFIAPDYYRPPLTYTIHWCVSQSVKTFFTTVWRLRPSLQLKNVQLPTEILTTRQRTRGGEGGRRHHMSSCRADITFYPISNLWNNTGSSVSEPLTSPVTAL